MKDDDNGQHVLHTAARDLQRFSVDKWPSDDCVRFVVIQIPGGIFIYEWFGHKTKLCAIKNFVRAMVPEMFPNSVRLLQYTGTSEDLKDYEYGDDKILNEIIEDAKRKRKDTPNAEDNDVSLRYPNTIFMRAVPGD